MAKTRMINTRFWNDGYIAELEPVEKLLFLYLLTNQHTDICGVYELPIRSITFDTGIPEDKVRNVMARFSLDKKVEYIDGWVIVKNFLKHQQKASPKVAQGIERSLKEIPDSIRSRIQYDTVSHLDSDSNLNSDSKDPPWFDKITEKHEEYTSLVKELAEKDYLSTRNIQRLLEEEMVPYYREKGSALKERWEKERSFDYLLRARTWVKKHHEYKKDVRCSEGFWHQKGESCYHRAPEKDYKSLPVSEFAKSLNKRI